VSGLFASGRIVDFVLLLVAAEAAALAWHSRRTGRGVPANEALAFLLSGACLLLALRAALAGRSWVWIAAPLAAAGVAHLVDLRLRWRR
jgi:hypothetical protein